MVTLTVVTLRQADRRGKALGCVVSLLLFAAALYYGAHVGEIYWRYFELRDAMRYQASLAPSLSDEEIRQHLAWKADSLFPGRAPRFAIRRSVRPGQITIQTEYSERVDLPFFEHTFVLRPRAEERL